MVNGLFSRVFVDYFYQIKLYIQQEEIEIII